MITGATKTEANYRAVNLDSSSSLKDFSLDRRKYFKRYILGEKMEDQDNKATTTGRVVETLLLEPEQFENRFFMSSCAEAPSALMLNFVEALHKFTVEATDDMGNVTRSFEEIAKDAYTESGFKIKFDAVISRFSGSNAEIYYKEIREVRSKGLTVVTAQDVNNAEKIVEELRTNSITAEIVNMVNSARWEVFNQFQIEGYSIDGHLFKSMLDKVVIDHEKKTIHIYDLKCVWAVENFYEEYYLYRRAYIQAYLYYHAVKSLTIHQESDLSGFTVEFPKFMVCDSTNYFSPLIYTLNEEDMKDAYEGFEHKGRKYMGVKQIIQELNWAVENNIWNISMSNYLNNGVINIKG
jgi:hypothetical protein